jgi:hypothetical protein
MMSKAASNVTEEARLHRQRIHEHMEGINQQRKLLLELERDGKETIQARAELKAMLVGLEAMLAEHQRLTWIKPAHESGYTPHG